MRLIQTFLTLAICSTLLNPASATESAQTAQDVTTTNVTQIKRAENLASAVQQKLEQSIEVSQLLVDEAERAIAQAQVELTGTDSEDGAAIIIANRNLEQAREALTVALSGLEKAQRLPSVSPQSITQLRDSGMGWGEIAQQLGVHPGLLGLGYNKRSEKKSNTTLDAANSSNSKQASASKNRNKSKKDQRPNNNSSNSSHSKSTSKGNSGNKGNNNKGNSDNSAKGGKNK